MTAATHVWGEQRSEGHRLVLSILDAAERIRKKADRFFRDYDLTTAQFNLLVVLATHPDGLPQSTIGDELVVSRANVTGLVGRALRLGLCRVLPDPDDGRVKIVRLTARGRRLLGRIEAAYFDEIDRLTGIYSEREAGRVAGALDRLVRNI